MKIRLLLPLIAFAAASPAFAWSGSVRAGDYRVTATLADDHARLQSISLASEDAASPRAMQLHAWFVDSEGGILAPAPLAAPNANGTMLVAYGKGATIPTNATALAVLAQPAGLTRTAAAATPAVVAQIALP